MPNFATVIVRVRFAAASASHHVIVTNRLSLLKYNIEYLRMEHGREMKNLERISPDYAQHLEGH